MLLGTVWLAQVVPRSVVTSTTDAWYPPTAQQSDVVGHEMPCGTEMLLSRLVVAHVVPPSVVDTITGLGPPPAPTAQQSDVVGHETPPREGREDCWLWIAQVEPPFVVAMITLEAFDVEELPTAQQLMSVGHETDVSVPVPAGTAYETQSAPPSVETATPPGLVSPYPPTATQNVVVGQVTARKEGMAPAYSS